MSIQLRCCEKSPLYEIEYEIGTVYLVCKLCSEQKHFARFIKSRKKIDSSFLKKESEYNKASDEIVEVFC